MTADPNSQDSKTRDSLAAEQSAVSRWEQLWQGQRENIKVLVIALVIALLVRVFIAEPRFIPSNSMEPTLHVGDRLIVDKISEAWSPLHRGDVVVFTPPIQLQEIGYDPRQAFIKRVIAQSGQTVRVSQGCVYIDGSALKEPYVLEAPTYEMAPFTIPLGYLFVMGDNRNDSNDSHVWGVLPEANVIGRAQFRFWPLNRLGPIS